MKSLPLRTLFLCAVVLGSLVETKAVAQNGGMLLWTNRYNGTANKGESASCIAVDNMGNVVVSGYSEGTGTGRDYATIKYSAAGVPLWTNRFNGGSFDVVNAMGLDSGGNVFVTGSSSGDYVTIKYSSGGISVWTNRYNGPDNNTDTATALTINTDGDVFVTGSSAGSGSSFDYATIKYSNAGVPLWTNRYNGPGNSSDEPYAIASDSNGDVFVTGASTGSGSSQDYTTIKYSTTGVPMWTNRYNGPGNDWDQAEAVVVDASNRVFVTGFSTATNGHYDYATIAYSGGGVPLWTNRYDGTDHVRDSASAMAIDGSGTVFVTGTSEGTNTASDYVTIAYSNGGVALWTNRYDGIGSVSDDAYAIAVDAIGNVFVGGGSAGLAGNVDLDYALIAYSNAGIPLWTNRYSGPAVRADYLTDIAVDTSGKVFVTGSSANTNNISDYATLAYSRTAPELNVVHTVTNTIVISWPSPSVGYTLQQNTNGIATTNWISVATSPTDDGTSRTVIVTPLTENQFYRLTHP
jgi:hypothetical protein